MIAFSSVARVLLARPGPARTKQIARQSAAMQHSYISQVSGARGCVLIVQLRLKYVLQRPGQTITLELATTPCTTTLMLATTPWTITLDRAGDNALDDNAPAGDNALDDNARPFLALTEENNLFVFHCTLYTTE